MCFPHQWGGAGMPGLLLNVIFTVYAFIYLVTVLAVQLHYMTCFPGQRINLTVQYYLTILFSFTIVLLRMLVKQIDSLVEISRDIR